MKDISDSSRTLSENGKEFCTCKKVRCKRHGKCQERIGDHKRRHKLPYCKRENGSLMEKDLREIEPHGF